MAKIIDGDNLVVTGASFTGEISGTTLTVTAVTSGYIDVGAVIAGTSVTAGTEIVSIDSVDNEGIGTYTVDTSQTVSSEAMTSTGNLAIDTTARTFTLTVQGALTSAYEGVTLQALYSKFIKLWETSFYNQFPFPMYAIDAKSGQFQFGFDGSRFSTWGPTNTDSEATRNMLRDGGWEELKADSTGIALDGTNSTGQTARIYVGVVSLGNIASAGTQAYYQRTSTEAAQNFSFPDEINSAVQVKGDATVDAATTTFDNRSFFKAFVREEAFTYRTSTLADTGETGTGAYKISVLLSNSADTNIVETDTNIASADPQYDIYDGITIDFFSAGQQKDIDGTTYPFSIVVDGNGATLQQIYTKVQYLLRQDADINTAGTAGVVNGLITDELMRFVGADLICAEGVFVENVQSAEKNNIFFTDDNGTARQFIFFANLTLNFNSFLQSGSTGYFAVYIEDSTSGGDDYGTASAILLQDKTPSDIQGVINAASVTFEIDFDDNTQGGRVDADDLSAPIGIVVVAGNPGSAKPVVARSTVTRSKTNSVTLTAEQDRAYVA